MQCFTKECGRCPVNAAVGSRSCTPLQPSDLRENNMRRHVGLAPLPAVLREASVSNLPVPSPSYSNPRGLSLSLSSPSLKHGVAPVAPLLSSVTELADGGVREGCLGLLPPLSPNSPPLSLQWCKPGHASRYPPPAPSPWRLWARSGPTAAARLGHEAPRSGSDASLSLSLAAQGRGTPRPSLLQREQQPSMAIHVCSPSPKFLDLFMTFLANLRNFLISQHLVLDSTAPCCHHHASYNLHLLI
jgi:hypothetical protein